MKKPLGKSRRLFDFTNKEEENIGRKKGMKTEDTFHEKIGRATGFRLPEGSLEGVYSRVMEQLPERLMKAPEKISRWHKVRPYIYMAAMFAGIWCMMKIFHSVSSPDISLDNPPAFVAEAAMQLPPQEESYSESDYHDFEIEQSVSEQYDNIESFEKDFGYELKPEYANSKIPQL